jgi:endoglucanase
VSPAPATRIRWLEALTTLVTAPGREERVVAWVEGWARRRGIDLHPDPAGNLLLSSPVKSRRRPVVAVAHLDHPALVVTGGGNPATAELRGGVMAPYLPGAAVESERARGRVVAFEAGIATVTWRGPGPIGPGDVFRWSFPAGELGVREGRPRAPVCDDLAGVAAALAALDILHRMGVSDFSVLLTRAEEVGFIGAIAACQAGTIPGRARVLSIECSKASAEAPLGGGPIIRVGDASTVFSSDLTNRIVEVARGAGLGFQRKLMTGGSCEATAFAAWGWEASGLCLALGNYHNMIDADGVRAGTRRARLGPEEISLADFGGLVDLLVAVVRGLDSGGSKLLPALREMYRERRGILEYATAEYRS